MSGTGGDGGRIFLLPESICVLVSGGVSSGRPGDELIGTDGDG